MVWPPVAMRGPADIDNAVDERQSPTLVLLLRIEGYNYAPVTGARIGRRNDHRAVSPLKATGNVERAQTLHVSGAVFFRPHHDVKGAGDWINHGRSDDAHIAMEVLVIAATGPGHIRVARGHDVGTQEICLPVRRSR